jgi:phospholipid/cholesterol/gamma-HCH transport system substrate-binding protein
VLADDALVRDVEATVATANDSIKKLELILTQLESTGADVGALVHQLRQGKPGLPGLTREIGQILADVRSMTRDFKTVTTRAPSIARNVDQSTENLPALLQQTTVTAQQLDRLLGQLRGHWLLGGGGAAPDAVRLPVTQARP